MMYPVSTMSQQLAASVHSLLADIDDTITTAGRLSALAYAALEKAHYSGLHLLLVTGRPAGWCDMIARFWPVAGVVGENGAFYFTYDRASQTMHRCYAIDSDIRQANSIRLQHIQGRVLKEVPGCAVAADQAYRETDLAIDFCEDVAALPMDQVARIKSIFEEEGATAKISSIHVNGWFGAYDKLTMTRRFAVEVLDLDIEAERDKVIFCGDSPNDEPMFDYFPNSCGVANVADFLERMESKPQWVASRRGGEGFTEIVDTITGAKTHSMEKSD